MWEVYLVKHKDEKICLLGYKGDIPIDEFEILEKVGQSYGLDGCLPIAWKTGEKIFLYNKVLGLNEVKLTPKDLENFYKLKPTDFEWEK